VDPGVRSPLVDFFRRGEVARDVRLLAARGGFAPRAIEQLAILLVLVDDADPEVAEAAKATVDALPRDPLALYLGRTDVPGEIRDFFAARGVSAVAGGAADDRPLLEVADPDSEVDGDDGEADGEGEEPAKAGGALARLVGMSVMGKVKVAMRGTREERAVLIRDPNRLVAAAVLSSPKLSENEVEGIARMANVSEEVLRIVGANRAWMKSYTVVAGLTRNPKTPIAMSMHLLQRLSDRDIKLLMSDRNVPEPVRIAARKRVSESKKQ
jgi:hypothetical protein